MLGPEMGLLWLLAASFCVGTFASCPSYPYYQARECEVKVTSSVHTSDLVPIVAGGNKDVLQHACTNEQYKEVTSCVSKIADSCSSEVRDMLYRTYDVSRMNAAWKQLCTKKEVYQKHIQCYKTQVVEIRNCDNEVAKQVKKMVRDGMSKQEKLEVSCVENRKGVECRDRLLQRTCGGEAAKVVTDYYRTAQPATCAGAFFRLSLILILVILIVHTNL